MIRKILSLFYICLLWVMVTGLKAEEPLSLMVDVDHREITIGSRITVAVKVFAKDNLVFQMPDDAKNFGSLELKDFVLHEKQKLADGRTLYRTDYMVTAYRPGDYEIPGFEVTYEDNGQQCSAKSETLPIKVLSVAKADEAWEALRDIKNVVLVPVSYIPLVLGVVGIVLLLGAGIAFGLWWRKRQQQEVLAPVAPPLPEEEEALQKLKSLNVRQFANSKDYYEKLTDIIRHYLQRRYGFLAVESTTGEIMRELKKKKMKFEDIMMLGEFLEFSDLVKFAKQEALHSECERSLQQAIIIVEKTKVDRREEVHVEAN